MTKTKKLLAATFAAAMALSVFTACGEESSNAESSKDDATTTTTTTTTTAATVATSATDPIEFEEPVVAESGDAFLYLADGQWYVQYDGTADTLMTYDAGVAKITGDGDYTVSVNAGTKACQYDITTDPNGGYECAGIVFGAVKVVDGTTLFPNMSIEIKEIRVDGEAIDLTAKNYTSSDDGKEMRANIYNSYVNSFPEDAHNADGAITGTFGEYSSMIVDTADFLSWTKIEVDFTVTGTGAEGGASTDAPAEGGEPTETTSVAE